MGWWCCWLSRTSDRTARFRCSTRTEKRVYEPSLRSFSRLGKLRFVPVILGEIADIQISTLSHLELMSKEYMNFLTMNKHLLSADLLTTRTTSSQQGGTEIFPEFQLFVFTSLTPGVTLSFTTSISHFQLQANKLTEISIVLSSVVASQYYCPYRSAGGG